MDPRMSYITPFFFIAFGMILMLGILKFREMRRAKKDKE